MGTPGTHQSLPDLRARRHSLSVYRPLAEIVANTHNYFLLFAHLFSNEDLTFETYHGANNTTDGQRGKCRRKMVGALRRHLLPGGHSSVPRPRSTSRNRAPQGVIRKRTTRDLPVSSPIGLPSFFHCRQYNPSPKHISIQTKFGGNPRKLPAGKEAIPAYSCRQQEDLCTSAARSVVFENINYPSSFGNDAVFIINKKPRFLSFSALAISEGKGCRRREAADGS